VVHEDFEQLTTDRDMSKEESYLLQ